MRRTLFGIAVLLLLVGFGFAQQSPMERAPSTAPVPPPSQVEVVNFPDPQNVVGTVEVENFPEVQQISGTVEVSNVPATPDQYLFVGVTSVTFSGNAGWLTLTRACQQEYPDSRMAFYDELLYHPNPPSVPAAAWIQVRNLVFWAPKNAGGASIWTNTGQDLQIGGDTVTCHSWSSWAASAVGTNVGTLGSLGTAPCTVSLAVACAAAQ